jgi:hypothetical protein
MYPKNQDQLVERFQGTIKHVNHISSLDLAITATTNNHINEEIIKSIQALLKETQTIDRA